MGVKIAVQISRKFSAVAALALLSVAALQAQPRLRLADATVGPVSVAVGANGPTVSVATTNSGSGSLSLSASSSVTWISTSIGAGGNCSVFPGQTCFNVNIALNTSALPKGTYTGFVTVSDPNAIDAPQTISVTVAVGGSVPDSINLFVAPNGSSDSAIFSTNNIVQSTVSPANSWLSFSFSGNNSFATTLPYRILAKHQPGMAEGAYNGTVTIAGSNVAADNKAVAVALRVTTQPIIQLSATSLRARAAQGAAKQLKRFVYSNRGQGSLTLGDVTASGGTWLTVQAFPQFNIFDVNIDPTNLAPGSYNGTITVASNAINGTQTVPIAVDVFAQGVPVSTRVANNATFASDEEIGQGTIVALFGDQLTLQAPISAASLPLPQTLGGARVLVNNVPAPVYYTQYDQINFQVPFDAALGIGSVRVERDGRLGNPITIRIAARAPRLLRLGIGEYGIAVNQDQSFPIPVTPGINSRPARAGDVLVIYALGIGQTSPSAVSGAASPTNPLAQIPATSTVTFGAGSPGGGSVVTPLFVGLTPNFVGLYQINVAVPNDSPRASRVGLQLTTGLASSNVVEIAVQ